MTTSRSTIIAAAAALALAAPAAAIAQDRDEAVELTKGEAELAKLLEGRVAGEPESCIRTFPSRNLNVIDGTAITYERGDTVWVNYTQNPDTLDEDDALLIRKFGNASRLCRLDNVTTFDRFNGFYTGNIFLTDFVPYKKVEDAS